MKKGAARLIAKTFGKTLGILFVMLGAGVAGYFLTILYCEVTKKVEPSQMYEHVIDVKTGSGSANLIYSVNKDDKIAAIVLELYNDDTHNMDYITIPAATEIIMSKKMYSEMLEVSKDMPQIARLSRLNEYFKGDVAYEYGIQMLMEEIGVDIGYFTKIPSKLFDSWFENTGAQDAPVYAPSPALIAKVGGKKEDDISEFMESVWDELTSDITLSQKQRYAKEFVNINPDYIHKWRIPAEVTKGKYSTYSIKKKSAEKLIQQVLDAPTYTSPQLETKEKKSLNTEKDSKNLKIYIANGIGEPGLAARYKTDLEKKGYQIQGIGNHKGGIQTRTTIYVKEKNQGKDLLTFFPNAAIEVTSRALTNHAEIEVVLGKDAKKNQLY